MPEALIISFMGGLEQADKIYFLFQHPMIETLYNLVRLLLTDLCIQLKRFYDSTGCCFNIKGRVVQGRFTLFSNSGYQFSFRD